MEELVEGQAEEQGGEVLAVPEGAAAATYRQRKYVVNTASLKTVKDIADFLGTIGMTLNLVGDTTMEQLGHNPKYWKEDVVADAAVPPL